ncbi:hypothetical protein DL767_007282 [Monosporascus sp. MG133]|nr:hypothetical protein DL767_007282 [Monosporascus sp. MG133]
MTHLRIHTVSNHIWHVAPDVPLSLIGQHRPWSSVADDSPSGGGRQSGYEYSVGARRHIMEEQVERFQAPVARHESLPHEGWLLSVLVAKVSSSI